MRLPPKNSEYKNLEQIPDIMSNILIILPIPTQDWYFIFVNSEWIKIRDCGGICTQHAEMQNRWPQSILSYAIMTQPIHCMYLLSWKVWVYLPLGLAIPGFCMLTYFLSHLMTCSLRLKMRPFHKVQTRPVLDFVL